MLSATVCYWYTCVFQRIRFYCLFRNYCWRHFFSASEQFFPTCQVRVVRFYLSCLVLLLLLPPPPPLLLLSLSSSSRCPSPLVVLLVLLLNCDSRSTVFAVGPQPRPSTLSVPCRTSTTTIPAQCSLPDLNREYPRPVFPAGPQPRPSTPSVPCRTSTASIHAKCSLPDLMRYARWNARRYARWNVR